MLKKLTLKEPRLKEIKPGGRVGKSIKKKTAEDLSEVFIRIKKLMVPYEKFLVSRINNSRGYDLWSKKESVFAGKLRTGVFFAALMLRPDYVGFYYMPIYVSDEFKKSLKKPVLLKTLKGKSCFHIKVNDPVLMNEIKSALQLGFRLYQEKGWV
jgi:hypothetical protein